MAHVVKVVFSDDEYEEVVRKAGLVPVSRWIRSVVTGGAKGVEATKPLKKNSKPAKAEAVPVVEADPAPQYFGDTLPPNPEIEKVEPAIQSWKDPARTYLPDLATERAARKPLTKPGTKEKK
jgi:hypothetical protein